MEISRFTPLDYAVLSAITSRLQPGTPLSESQLHTADTSREAHLKFGGFIVKKQREAAGFIWYTQYADYYRPEQVVLFGGILPEFRRRGIDSKLLETLERHLLALGVTCLQTQTSENEPTRTFLERRGFSETWRRLPYRLIPAQAQTDGLEGLEKGLEAQQIRVITYKNLSGDGEYNEKLRALSWLLEQDVPYGEPPTELSLETFVRERLERPEVLKDAFFIALRGKRFIGMSSL